MHNYSFTASICAATLVSVVHSSIGSGALAAEQSIKSVDPNDGWSLVSKSDALTIYTRVRAESPLKEFRGVGGIDASTTAVNAVISDFENFPQFMPYVAEARVCKQEGDTVIGYQRLSLRFCADRDYTLRVVRKSFRVADGIVFSQTWSPANELGPPPKKGVVRIQHCEGGWLLEPDGPAKTRAIYSIYTDTGGAIPAWLANHASQVGISKLFAAVRRQVKDPKYALTKP